MMRMGLSTAFWTAGGIGIGGFGIGNRDRDRDRRDRVVRCDGENRARRGFPFLGNAARPIPIPIPDTDPEIPDPAPVRFTLNLAVMLFILTGCAAQRSAPPTTSDVQSVPPDLTGGQVLMLPVQTGPVPTSDVRTAAPRFDGVTSLDAELKYWLPERAPRVRWILPDAIDRTLARNPALEIKPRALDVAVFRRAQVKRIGDPLFGDLRRIAAILDTRLALVPVAAEFKPTSATEGRLEIALALIDTTFGDVLWYGVIAGDPAAPDSPAIAASLAQRVATMFSR
jgi:hypothetical protein